MPTPSTAIRHVGDPVLRTRATPVTAFDDRFRALVARMFEAMAAADGVGLAANQVGNDLAVFVLDCDGVRAVVANPELELVGDLVETEPEGCLSVPGHSWPTPRRARATVRGQDEHGRPVVLAGEGLLARCLQHEVDHLAGRVYLDRLPGPLRRRAWAAVTG
ncbi:peptide deformylase [Aquipuribacter sp. SD81]|uniref:peptide deformylase n=1 Tax=Aquipuribacter sp. SD81 TaxID=3127703 RepID=UPI0030176220